MVNRMKVGGEKIYWKEHIRRERGLYVVNKYVGFTGKVHKYEYS